jgi:hypothetical protein
MTRKHFAAIAATLLAEKPAVGVAYQDMTPWQRGAYDSWNTTVLAFAAMCRAQNPRFNRARFLAACGVAP